MTLLEKFLDTLTHNFADLGDVESATRVGLRLLLAAVLGAMIGWNRESAGKPAGLRTHVLVAVGSALFIIAPRRGRRRPASRVPRRSRASSRGSASSAPVRS